MLRRILVEAMVRDLLEQAIDPNFNLKATLRMCLSTQGKRIHALKQFESDITFHIGKQEAELASRVNISAFQGDLYRLKELIRGGAHPNKTDYDGRSPLHLAASRGYEDVALFRIELDGVDINIPDKFGNTPLFEAIKNGHDRVASLLTKHGESLDIDDGGNCLYLAVAKGDSDFLKRLLSNGVDPNSRDYDHRTPLHIAVAEGLYLMASNPISSDQKKLT